MEYTLTLRFRNAEEMQEAVNLLSRKDVPGRAKDMAVDAGAKQEGDKAPYQPSNDRCRLAYDALQKCQRIKLADAGTKLEAWARAFPNVDMAYWITKQDAWAVSSDTKWSTKGWARHLNWRLSKSQDEARGSYTTNPINSKGSGVTLAVTPIDPAVDAWVKAAE